jgi:hypothetical protein
MVVMGGVVCAQDSVAVKKVEPKGKAIITVFAGLGMDVQSADAIMTNGEGYKKIQGDMGF